jgi:two-component system phosphate regulon sensor histidine kinase PhoR
MVAGLMLYVRASNLLPLNDRYVEVVIVSMTSGVGVSLVVWVVMSRFAGELNRAVAHVDALGRVDCRGALPFRPGMGLAELTDTFERATESLHKRIDQLVAQRRELTLQMRIAESERRHAHAIINSIADAVVVTDAFNEVVLANQAAARVLDFELAGALHRPVDQLMPDAALVKLIKDTREIGRLAGPRHAAHQLRHGDRTATYDVCLACVPAAEDGGSHNDSAGVVTILRDVTREREIAEMKSEFVSNVSHELRTPLSSIKAYMEMLVDGEADDEQTRTEFYNVIQGETNRLSRLIDNILNISRIESGVVRVQREQIALNGLIHEAIDVMRPQARARRIELIDRIAPTFFQVLADKDMLYQATLNLLSNAIKYTMPKGKVTVTVDVDDIERQARVAVSDTGVGVEPEDIPHLFNKFYRVADHKKIAKGTGLGLNLVKHIVEIVHGGRVFVESQPGRGSTFTYTLPLAEHMVHAADDEGVAA